MSEGYTTQSTSQTSASSGVDAPYPPPAETPETSASEGNGESTSSYIPPSEDASTDASASAWLYEAPDSDVVFFAGTGLDASEDLDETSAVTTAEYAEHAISKNGKTAFYDLLPNGEFTLSHIPLTAVAKVRQRDTDSITIDIIDQDEHVLESVVVNYLPPLGKLFLNGGKNVDLSSIRALPIADHIYVNTTAEDVLPQNYDDHVNADSLYRLGDFQYKGDSYRLDMSSPGAVLDLVGSGNDSFHVLSNTKGVDAGRTNFVIRVTNSSGKQDIVYLDNVDPTVELNLFGGKLAYANIPEAAQALFKQNYVTPSVDDERNALIAEKMALLERRFADLPTLKEMSRGDSDALYSEFFKVLSRTANLLDVHAAVEDVMHSIANETAAREFVHNVIQVLTTTYPELLSKLGEWGATAVLSNALISTDMDKVDIKDLFILDLFSGKDRSETESFLQDVGTTLEKETASWNSLIASGRGLFNAYLQSSEYRHYAHDIENGTLTLTTPEPAPSPT